MKLLLIGIIGICLFFFLTNTKEKKVNQIAFENLNLNLTGVVIDVDEIKEFNAYGIINVRILKTNISEYDPRDSVEFYYCIIKDSVAEIYDHAFKSMIGDTIHIDTKRKLQSWGTNWDENQSGSIHINPNKNYYEYIRKNTRFKSHNNPT